MSTPLRPTGPQPPRYTGPRPPGAARRPQRKSGGGGGGAVVCLLLLAGMGGGGYFYYQQQQQRRAREAQVTVEVKPQPKVAEPAVPHEEEVKKQEPPAPVVQPKVVVQPKPAPAPKAPEPAPAPPPPSASAADEAKLAALFATPLPLNGPGGGAAVQQRAKAALEAALSQDKMADWAGLLRRSLLAAVKSAGSSSVTPDGLVALNQNPAFALALDQAAFAATLPPEAFASLGKDGEQRSFYAWLLSSPQALESWLLTVPRPSKDLSSAELAKGLEQWAKLAQTDHDAIDKYSALALACGLVFRKPMTFKWNEENISITAPERYAYYKEHGAKGELAVHPEKLSARELLWVVSARVPQSELEWALHKMHLPQRTWGSTYDLVKYDMERAVKGTNRYDGYFLSEILKKGGICGDRTYFGVNTARAAGIPAAGISGDGARGGHAWMSWLSAKNEWKFSGRYAGYPLGNTNDPLTNKRLSEQEIIRKSERSATDEGLLRGLRGVWLAQAVEAEGAVDIAGLMFEGASVLGDRIPAVWQAKLAFWGAHRAETPVEQWRAFLDVLKRSMKEDPDMLAEARTAEEKYIFPRQDAALAMADLKKDARRADQKEGKTNVDPAAQVAKVIKQEAEELQKTNATDAIRLLYDKAYREHGKNAAVFRKLTTDCWSFVKSDNAVATKACHDMEQAFRRYVNTGGDYFAITSQMSALKIISKCYRDIGQDKKADTLEKDVAKTNEKAKKAAL